MMILKKNSRHAEENDEDVSNALSEESSTAQEDNVAIFEDVVASNMDSSRQDQVTLPRAEDGMYAGTFNHYPLLRIEVLKL